MIYAVAVPFQTTSVDETDACFSSHYPRPLNQTMLRAKVTRKIEFKIAIVMLPEFGQVFRGVNWNKDRLNRHDVDPSLQ